jgi:hypothetical protein
MVRPIKEERPHLPEHIMPIAFDSAKLGSQKALRSGHLNQMGIFMLHPRKMWRVEFEKHVFLKKKRSALKACLFYQF